MLFYIVVVVVVVVVVVETVERKEGIHFCAFMGFLEGEYFAFLFGES